MKLQCKVQVLQAGQYDNSQQTGHSVYMDDCKKLCNIISYPVAIRTEPRHRSVFAIHTGSSLFLKFI